MPDKPVKKDSNKDDHLLSYFKENVRETIAYVLLILGIILLFFYPLYGGLLVGLIAGIYFGDDIVDYLLNWKKGLNTTKGITENLISAGVAIAFFIMAPTIFIGAAIAIAIKQLFIAQQGNTKK